MNFYLGKSIKNFDFNGESVYFSDEILAYIYAIRDKIEINIESLGQIEPYDDVVIEGELILEIRNVCEYVLKNNLLCGYEFQEEAQESLVAFVDICKVALERGQNLISIGD